VKLANPSGGTRWVIIYMAPYEPELQQRYYLWCVSSTILPRQLGTTKIWLCSLKDLSYFDYLLRWLALEVTPVCGLLFCSEVQKWH